MSLLSHFSDYLFYFSIPFSLLNEIQIKKYLKLKNVVKNTSLQYLKYNINLNRQSPYLLSGIIIPFKNISKYYIHPLYSLIIPLNSNNFIFNTNDINFINPNIYSYNKIFTPFKYLFDIILYTLDNIIPESTFLISKKNFTYNKLSINIFNFFKFLKAGDRIILFGNEYSELKTKSGIFSSLLFPFKKLYSFFTKKSITKYIFKPEYVIIGNKKDLYIYFKDLYNSYKKRRYIIFCPLIIYFFRKIFKYFKTYFNNTKYNEKEILLGKCIICKKNIRNIVIFNCNHYIVCESCFIKNSKKCNICQIKNTNYLIIKD